jgi:hypothetical protein
MIGHPKPVTLVLPEYRDWIRQQPCVLADQRPCHCQGFLGVGNRIASEPCHIKSRGARGGDFNNLYPGCQRHHGEQHRNGIDTFGRKHGLNLTRIARALTVRYREENAWRFRDAS